MGIKAFLGLVIWVHFQRQQLLQFNVFSFPNRDILYNIYLLPYEHYHGDEPYRILVVQNRILFVISGFYLCKRVFVGRGKYPENHM